MPAAQKTNSFPPPLYLPISSFTLGLLDRSQVQVGASGNLAATSRVAKWLITCLPPDVPGSFLPPCRGVGRVSGLVMHQGAGKKVWRLSTSFTQ